jgi:hypothetical protein
MCPAQIPAGSVLSAQGPLFGVALATWGAAIRTYVYVDGFNLYYGAVKGTQYKWLNPVELAKQLLPPNHTVDKVKYFTARVSGASDPGAPKRQQALLSALSTLSEVELHYGRFLSKTIWRPIMNLPVAGADIHSPSPTSLPAGNHTITGGTLTATNVMTVGTYPPKGVPRPKRKITRMPLPNALVTEVHAMEEKGSDVNLAAHLLNDAWKGTFDVAAVISNDTDLITPIQMVAVDMKKPVFVICPGKWQMADGLRKVATYARHIRRSMLVASQFPDPIPGTTIHKPTDW